MGKTEGLAPQFWEQAPPLKTVNLGGKNTWNMYHSFFTASEHIQNLHFAKKLVKLTNPALSSGPNNSLPLIWGSHHQLDYQSSWATN